MWPFLDFNIFFLLIFQSLTDLQVLSLKEEKIYHKLVLEGVWLIEQLLVLLPGKTTKLRNPQAHNYSFGMILHKQINAVTGNYEQCYICYGSSYGCSVDK